MKYLFRKFVLAGIAAAVMLVSGSVYAADTPVDPIVDGDISLAKCVQQGNIDFLLFLNATLASDGFEEALLEPWRDVLSHNQCQSTDILSLLQQRNKIRATIRDSFFTCQKDDIPQLKKAFAKLNMEIYYARHVVDGKLVISLPYDILSTRMLEDPESLFSSSSDLYAQMKDNYYDPSLLSLKEFDQNFTLLEKKYDSRKENYVICETSSWSQVQEKWEEFINDSAGLGESSQNFAKAVNREAEKIVESHDRASLGEYLSEIFALSINNIDAKSGLDEIVDDLSADYGDYGAYGAPSIHDVINSISSEDFRYSTDKLEAQMRSKYTALYLEGGDGAVQLFMDELVNLNEILKSSIKPINIVENCSSTINSRQCPGN